MPKISIIVPIYNVERYIHRCIESILNQNFCDFELILVNDGSPDQCGDICDEYALKDNRIKVIHKNNGGLSSARNAGIDIAKGKYIGFIDSDDWIEPDMYEILYQNIKKYNADISMCKYKTEKNDLISIYNTPLQEEVLVVNTEQAIQAMVDNVLFDLTQFACDKLYKRELFEGIRYPEGKLYEDVATTYKLIDKCNVFVYNNSTKYHYSLNSNSISQRKFDHSQLDILETRQELYRFIRNNYPKAIQGALCQYISANVSIVNKLILSDYMDKKVYKDCREIIRKYILVYLKAHGVKKRQKLYASFIYLCPYFIVVLFSSLIKTRN